MKKTVGFFAAVLAVLLAAYPAPAIEAAKEAMTLCAKTLIPSLFPFFVCANTIVASGMTEKAAKPFGNFTGTFFRVGGIGASAILLGFISGYPAGAAVCCKLYQRGSLSGVEAERLLGYTNNAGPLFILGAIGMGVYRSQSAGLVLLGSCVLSSLCTGWMMRFYGKAENKPHPVKASIEKSDPMGDAIRTVLRLCGFVIFFAVFLAFLKKAGIITSLSQMLQKIGMEEKTAMLLSMGVFELSTAASAAKGALPSMAALLSFGGLSVFLQTLSLIREAGLSVKGYVIGKTISPLLAALICKGLMRFFPVYTKSGMMLQKSIIYAGYLSAAVCMAMGVYLLYRLLNKLY